MKLSALVRSQLSVEQLADPWVGPLALATQIPSLGFWGVKVLRLSNDECEVKLPFTFLTKNPFRSIYFSALLGAGELASGALVLKHLGNLNAISMLVVEMQSRFLKKAKSVVVFRCREGQLIAAEVAKALRGEATEFWSTVEGTDETGDVVCELKVKWSLLGKAEKLK